MTDIYSAHDAAEEEGQILASHPCSMRRLQAVRILSRYTACDWEIILALLPGLADHNFEVYQATVLALSRMRLS